MEPGLDPELVGAAGHKAALAHSTLAAVGVPPWDRFEFDRLCGYSPEGALRRLLESFPEEAVEEGLAVTVELIKSNRLQPREAIQALEAIGIHALSLFGARWDGTNRLRGISFKKLLGLSPTAKGEALYIQPGGGFSLRGFRDLEQLPAGVKTHYLHLTALPRLRRIGEGLEVFRCLRILACPALMELPPLANRELNISIRDCPAFAGFRGPILVSEVYLKGLPAMAELAIDPGCDRPSVILNECASLRKVVIPNGHVWEMDLFRSGISELCGLHQVDENLLIEECEGLSSIEGPLVVGGTIRLRALPRLRKLGQGIRIGENLHLRAVGDAFELPEDLRVGGKIYVHQPVDQIRIPESLAGKVVFR